MSNGRTIFWLTVLALAAIAANVFLSWRVPPTRRLHRQTLLDPSLDVSSIVLSRAGEPETELVRDGRWRLVRPYAGTVDAQVVLRLLDALGCTAIEAAMSESELAKLGRTQEDFGLTAPALRITVSGGSEVLSLALGDSTPTSNGVYVAIAGSDSVLVVPKSVRTAADVSAEAFRERSLFPFGPESVLAFDLRKAGETPRSFVRTDDGWRVGDEVASSAKVRDFLSCLAGASAADFIWPVGATNEEDVVSESRLVGYGLDSGAAVSLNLRCRDGVDRRILLGNDAGEGRSYALVHNGSAIVSVDSALKAAALEGTRSFADTRLFPLEESAVGSFTLVSGDTSYVLARGEGGAWRLDSPVSAPADAKLAAGLLERILALAPSDISAEGLGVSVSTNRGPFVIAPKVLLGSSRLEDLRSREILAVDPALVKRLVSTAGGKQSAQPVSVVYSRNLKVWNAESEAEKDRAVDADAVAGVLSALSPLKAARIVTLKATASDLSRYGLDAPFHTLAVDQEKDGSVRRNVFIGSETKGGRFATVGSSEAIFVLPPAIVRALTAPLVAK